jgi:hypothetical protein
MPLLPPELRQIDLLRSGAQVLREQFNALRADLVAGRSGLMGTAALAIGSTKPRVATGAFYFVDSGIMELKAAVAAGTAFTDTTHDIALDGSLVKEAIYVLSIASGGTITITMGTIALTGAAVAPAVPAGEIYLGQVLIAHDGSTEFDANQSGGGEGDLDGAHLTVTYTSADPEALPSVNQLTSSDLTS